MIPWKEWIDLGVPKLVDFGLKVLLSLVVFYVGTKVIRWILKVLRKSMEGARVDTGVIQFLCSLGRILLYGILIFSIGTNFGITEGTVAALLGSAGLTIGIGLQGGLANLAGGVMILIFKPFQVGDYIIDHGSGCEGTVKKIDICYTTLATMDNKRIVIPNGSLSNSSISNVTSQDQRKLEVKVGISYESDLKKAKEILEGLLKEDPDIQSDEEMVVFVDSLGESSVVVGFRAWVSTEAYWKTLWRMNERIKLSFDREGIGIPYPQVDVHVKEMPGRENSQPSLRED